MNKFSNKKSGLLDEEAWDPTPTRPRTRPADCTGISLFRSVLNYRTINTRKVTAGRALCICLFAVCICELSDANGCLESLSTVTNNDPTHTHTEQQRNNGTMQSCGKSGLLRCAFPEALAEAEAPEKQNPILCHCTQQVHFCFVWKESIPTHPPLQGRALGQCPWLPCSLDDFGLRCAASITIDLDSFPVPKKMQKQMQAIQGQHHLGLHLPKCSALPQKGKSRAVRIGNTQSRVAPY